MRSLLALLALALLVTAGPARADHSNVYEEDRSVAGEVTYRFHPPLCEARARCVPADPDPGRPTLLEVHVRPLDPGIRFEDEVTVTILRDDLLGEDPVVWGPETRRAPLRFQPVLPGSGAYKVRLDFHFEGEPWTLEYHVASGLARVPWTGLGAGALLVGVALVLLKRFKRR